MRKLILRTMLILPLLAVLIYAMQSLASQPFGESFGYSSEDFVDGGSYLGVDTRDVTADRLAALKLKEEHGVEVTMVDQDAPAGKAGIKEHDVILSLNGTEVESVEQLRRMIRETPPGRVVTLGISRDGQPMTIKAQLADRKKTLAFGPKVKDFKFVMPPMPPMPDIDVPVSIVMVHSATRSGLMVENLTPQLGDFFGAKNGQGVLVRSVEKGSRAEKAGFRAGDVIVRVNGEPINDTGDFTHALRGHKDNTVNVNIIRDKKEQTLTLTLPERKESELFEESFDIPEIDAETRIDLSQVRSEVARIKPELERAAREIHSHQGELKRQILEMQRELRDQQLELQEELKQELQKSCTEI